MRELYHGMPFIPYKYSTFIDIYAHAPGVLSAPGLYPPLRGRRRAQALPIHAGDEPVPVALIQMQYGLWASWPNEAAVV